jgi:hypothetical protein
VGHFAGEGTLTALPNWREYLDNLPSEPLGASLPQGPPAVGPASAGGHVDGSLTAPHNLPDDLAAVTSQPVDAPLPSGFQTFAPVEPAPTGTARRAALSYGSVDTEPSPFDNAGNSLLESTSLI